jgi:hypothetical protein
MCFSKRRDGPQTARRYNPEDRNHHSTAAKVYIVTGAKYNHFVLSVYMAVQPFVGPWPLFQFLNLLHSR